MGEEISLEVEDLGRVDQGSYFRGLEMRSLELFSRTQGSAQRPEIEQLSLYLIIR